MCAYMDGVTPTAEVYMETLVIGGLVLYVFYAYLKMDDSLEYKMRKIKGDSGENVVNNELSRLDNNYKVIYDLKINRCQIDHLVVYDKCQIVFVIETKRWTGKITGRKLDNKWEQINGSYSHWMNNPIMQNEKHIKVLSESNKYLGYRFVNVVVFVGSDSIPRLKNVIMVKDLYKLIVNYKNI